jgi:hypothetical protein
MRVGISFFVSFLLFLVQGLVNADYSDYDSGRYRVGGPPDYRYYDKATPAQPGPYDQYKAQQDDANVYWGNRYETPEPSAADEYDVNRGLMDME